MRKAINIAGNRFDVKRYADGSFHVYGPERAISVSDFMGAADEIAWQVMGGREGDLGDKSIARAALRNAGF